MEIRTFITVLAVAFVVCSVGAVQLGEWMTLRAQAENGTVGQGGAPPNLVDLTRVKEGGEHFYYATRDDRKYQKYRENVDLGMLVPVGGPQDLAIPHAGNEPRVGGVAGWRRGGETVLYVAYCVELGNDAWIMRLLAGSGSGTGRTTFQLLKADGTALHKEVRALPYHEDSTTLFGIVGPEGCEMMGWKPYSYEDKWTAVATYNFGASERYRYGLDIPQSATVLPEERPTDVSVAFKHVRTGDEQSDIVVKRFEVKGADPTSFKDLWTIARPENDVIRGFALDATGSMAYVIDMSNPAQNYFTLLK